MNCTFFMRNLCAPQSFSSKTSQKISILTLLSFICLNYNIHLCGATAQAQTTQQPAGQHVADAAAQAFTQAAINQVNNGYIARCWEWTKVHKEELKSAGMITFTAVLFVATSPLSGPTTILLACGKGLICGVSVEGARQLLSPDDIPVPLPQPQMQRASQQPAPDIHIHNENHPELTIRYLDRITYDLTNTDNELHQLQQDTANNFTEIRKDLFSVHQELGAIHQDVHALDQRVGSIETSQEELRNIVLAAVSRAQRGRRALPPASNHVIVEPFDDEDEE